MEAITLEQKINSEITKHRFSPHQLNTLLNISKSNSVITDLFKEFETNEKLLRLLTLHRQDLFALGTDIPTSLLFFCNLPKSLSQTGKNSMSNALKYIISEKIEKTEENGLTLLNNAIGKSDKIVDDFKDIITYFLVDFFRNNPSLLNMANSDEFNYKIMKGNTAGDKNILELTTNYFDVKLNNYNNSVDPEIRKRIEKIVLDVVSNVTSTFEQTIESFSKITPDLTLQFHKQSIVWLSSILEKTDQGIDEYVDSLDTLFRIKAINNRHIFTWCEICNKHEPSFQIVTGKIAPSNLVSKKECFQCQNKKHYSFSAIYSLNPALKDILDSKDGILATYLSWLLDKRGFSVECSKYAGVYETDILVNNQYLIECKLFKSDKDENAMWVNIKKSFSQLEKQIKKFQEDGVTIKQAYLLWNLDIDDKDLKSKLDTDFKAMRDQYGFRIIPYYEVEDFVNELK